MKKSQQTYRRLAVVALVAVIGLIFPGMAEAADTVTYSEDTSLYLSGSAVTLTILADSAHGDDLTIGTTSFTLPAEINVGFTVRYTGPSPVKFTDGAAIYCTRVGDNNDFTFTSAHINKEISLTSTVCSLPSSPPSGGGGGSSYTTPYISLTSPDGGGTLAAGSSHQITWSAGGTGLTGIRLKLSTDGGVSYPTTITSSTSNDSSHSWTVPNISTTTASIKAEAVNVSGSSLAFDVSDANFTITAAAAAADEPAADEPAADEPTAEEIAVLEAAAPEVDPTSTGTYDATEATEATPTIATDLGLLDEPTPTETPACEGGTLIKGSTAAVYYCGADGKRYVFPNQHIYNTWFADFSSVITVTDAVLASAQLGGNVTYKPGVRMIKITSDPKTYAVSRGGYLRWVQTEEVAVALYGAAWNTKIDDVDPAFFFNYSIGDPITIDDI